MTTHTLLIQEHNILHSKYPKSHQPSPAGLQILMSLTLLMGRGMSWQFLGVGVLEREHSRCKAERASDPTQTSPQCR